ncbi:Maf family protein [Alkalimarinus alittae]|uniref:dTTP/UTP pyrophosphatase n=1 Tax=Alkalimarinus alittae TaxID=2961619 RepID=A0ABY6MZE0_9ALTE|nr:Maf family protein [Alkalimarinus alittae]UZE95216.1 Maf-like protein [Alkalimarinus alittae]
MKLILASASPRRSELLAQIGVRFNVQAVDIDETPLPQEEASSYVLRMAREKVSACVALQQDDSSFSVLGADTSVIVDGEILGKPADFTEAKTMLLKLSGRVHQVMTSVCLVTCHSGINSGEPEINTQLVVTDVTFKSLSEDQIKAYWQSGEPQDKAGSYGIQGFGAVFVERISGSYSAVVGLPLAEVAEMLSLADVMVWDRQG